MGKTAEVASVLALIDNKEVLRERLGSNLRIARFLREMNQKKLAAALGFHQTAISRIENGGQGLAAEELYLAAKILQTPMERFFLSADEFKKLTFDELSRSSNSL